MAASYALAGKRTVLADADPQGLLDPLGRTPCRPGQRGAADRRQPQAQLARGAARRRAAGDRRRRRRRHGRGPDPFPRRGRRGGGAGDALGALDIEATVGFLNTLAKVPRVHQRKLPVGLVLNRSKPWTNATQQALQMLAEWPYPVVAQLRDSQAYVVLVGLGRSLFDYHSVQVRDHQQDWEPLLKWLKKA
ncbi:ParA family protein [Xanthomonas sacchari]|nr:ParA family protein [Xanthomonas sacchari]